MSKKKFKLLLPSKEFLLSIYEFYKWLSHLILYPLAIGACVFAIYDNFSVVSILFVASVIFGIMTINHYIDDKSMYILSLFLKCDDENIYLHWEERSGEYVVIIPISQVKSRKRKLDGVLLYGDFMRERSGRPLELIDSVYIDDIVEGTEYLWDVLENYEEQGENENVY